MGKKKRHFWDDEDLRPILDDLPDNELSFHVRNSLREYIVNHPYLARKRWREVVYGEGPLNEPETEKENNKKQ
ncbi:hypothetical protein Desde_3136 [Desulfitobacterium dehalogenans ATCC 51507]|uniref:Uncharacterized protein n=1 Tax=Desulfitobacterium dehalogenans (strain ATCC 51507 / DSM 9161 / JW/IU-DC1) TaxID=756499 RepID=I4ABU3_DESDJ|nr:hypothetical protein [Desulfitobacterium dehalogenans]AFM01428.1 hypothetical protein Desde_3136 [Desulfitobacterium dehalogenans ATCC 51507]